MKLSWTTDAVQDRHAIFDYIEAENRAAAVALDDVFAESAHRLTEYPRLGHPGRVEGTCEWVVHRNYILIYDVSGDHIRILRVLHAARQWPSPRKASI